MGVGRLQGVAAVALHVEGGAEAGDEGVRVEREDAGRGRVAAHLLVPRAEVEGEVAPDLPPVVHVEGGRLDVELRAPLGEPVQEEAASGLEHRGQVPVGVQDGVARGVRRVVGVEDVARRGLRVAALEGVLVVLEAHLEVVLPERGRGQEVGQVARDLVVGAVLGVRAVVEVGGVVVLPRLDRRRVAEGEDRGAGDHVRVRPVPVAEAQALLGVLQLGEHVGPEHPVVVRDEERLRVLRDVVRGGGDAEVEGGGGVARAVAGVGRLEGVVRGDRPGQLALEALVVPVLQVRHPGVREGVLAGAVLRPARDEEPEAVLHDGPAQGGLEHLVEVALPLDVFLHLERRLLAPGGVREVGAEAARELVPAPLGDGVDGAAPEAAELGGDARGEDLGLLDRVLDEHVVRGAERAVGDVDTVDQEQVVVGEASGDRDLVGVRGVVGEPRRQLGDAGDRAAGGKRVDLPGTVVGAGLRRRDRRGRLGRDHDTLRHPRHAHGDGQGDRAAHDDRDRLLERAEPRQREADPVRPGGQALEDVVPVHGRRGAPLAHERRGASDDRHARQRRPVGRGHGAVEDAGLHPLRERRPCGDERQQQNEVEADAPAVLVIAPHLVSLLLPWDGSALARQSKRLGRPVVPFSYWIQDRDQADGPRAGSGTLVPRIQGLGLKKTGTLPRKAGWNPERVHRAERSRHGRRHGPPRRRRSRPVR